MAVTRRAEFCNFHSGRPHDVFSFEQQTACDRILGDDDPCHLPVLRGMLPLDLRPPFARTNTTLTAPACSLCSDRCHCEALVNKRMVAVAAT